MARYARDLALRIELLPLYDHRCSLCDLRLRYRNQLEAEAAHVVPVRAAGVDDVRNPLALCRTHHWAFDAGLWTIDAAGRAKVVTTPDSDEVDLAALRELAGTALRLPTESAVRPHPDALAWHRSKVYLEAA